MKAYLIIILCAAVLCSACEITTLPQRTEEPAPEYTELVDHVAFHSHLYNERFAGKRVWIKLYFGNIATGPEYAWTKVIPDVGDKVVIHGYEDASSSQSPMNYSQGYFIPVPRTYRDLLFSLKSGEPITVYGQVHEYRSSGGDRPMYIHADRLVRGHDDTGK